MNVKKAIFRDIYKPNNKLYCKMTVCALFIILLLFYISPNSVWFTIVSGVGSGAIASILVAWLIDKSNCQAINTRDARIRMTYFNQIFGSFVRLFDALSGYANIKDDIKRKWYEWAYITTKNIDALQMNKDEKAAIIDIIEFAENTLQNVLDKRLEILIEQLLTEEELRNITEIKTILYLRKEEMKRMDWKEHIYLSEIDEIKELIEQTEILKVINNAEYSTHDSICFSIDRIMAKEIPNFIGKEINV